MPGQFQSVVVQVLGGGGQTGVQDELPAVRSGGGQSLRHATRPEEGLGPGVLAASVNNL